MGSEVRHHEWEDLGIRAKSKYRKDEGKKNKHECKRCHLVLWVSDHDKKSEDLFRQTVKEQLGEKEDCDYEILSSVMKP